MAQKRKLKDLEFKESIKKRGWTWSFN